MPASDTHTHAPNTARGIIVSEDVEENRTFLETLSKTLREKKIIVEEKRGGGGKKTLLWKENKPNPLTDTKKQVFY